MAEKTDTMADLVERNRRHVAAYAALNPATADAEAAFLATADTTAGNIIERDPPPLQDYADLLAAIRYVAEDVGFLQEGHARVLARALQYLTAPERGGGAS